MGILSGVQLLLEELLKDSKRLVKGGPSRNVYFT